jgi:hypothetical protein
VRVYTADTRAQLVLVVESPDPFRHADSSMGAP